MHACIILGLDGHEEWKKNLLAKPRFPVLVLYCVRSLLNCDDSYEVSCLLFPLFWSLKSGAYRRALTCFAPPSWSAIEAQILRWAEKTGGLCAMVS
jgi:hypothetical protein